IEGFAGTGEGNLIADRIQRAGGTIDIIALDEPHFFASIYEGPNACGWSVEKVAAEVAQYADLMRARFPNVIRSGLVSTPFECTRRLARYGCHRARSR
ncbi:MAG: hypothetical protein U9N84_09705, partial [Actinomycetota bacterium]|nr:hypothetical protein [Actinomycetota bacterium]